jgi:hypothetical protein
VSILNDNIFEESGVQKPFYKSGCESALKAQLDEKEAKFSPVWRIT